ncbi:hypothetical protein ACFTXK_31565, partial [Streptomyces sp. NPDC056956]|uniref:hypothetical protein n=1 Tax=Streptomyces sp. NPDC056956 TaxID=3345980 RepID=UPI00362B3045
GPTALRAGKRMNSLREFKNPLRVFLKGASRLSCIHASREYGFPLRSNPRGPVPLRFTGPGHPLRSCPTGYAEQQQAGGG